MLVALQKDKNVSVGVEGFTYTMQRTSGDIVILGWLRTGDCVPTLNIS